MLDKLIRIVKEHPKTAILSAAVYILVNIFCYGPGTWLLATFAALAVITIPSCLWHFGFCIEQQRWLKWFLLDTILLCLCILLAPCLVFLKVAHALVWSMTIFLELTTFLTLITLSGASYRQWSQSDKSCNVLFLLFSLIIVTALSWITYKVGLAAASTNATERLLDLTCNIALILTYILGFIFVVLLIVSVILLIANKMKKL